MLYYFPRQYCIYFFSFTFYIYFFFFFFNDTATTEIYTLSLHDALPIYSRCHGGSQPREREHAAPLRLAICSARRDRKSTRLNSSHGYISYAVFCLKKKKNNKLRRMTTSCNRADRTAIRRHTYIHSYSDA